jgi:hypothetical protein
MAMVTGVTLRVNAATSLLLPCGAGLAWNPLSHPVHTLTVEFELTRGPPDTTFKDTESTQ